MDTTGTGLTARTLDTTKRRDPPPLNVYVRIRPFIADELERGEDQKLLDTLNEKHIAVKVYPTINNTIRNVQASYNEYEVGNRRYSAWRARRNLSLLEGHANIQPGLYSARVIRANSRTTYERDLHRFQLASVHVGSDQQW